GYYDNLAFDSELRSYTTRKFFEGRQPTDREIAAIYESWGAWKYLAYWFDLA
ncbi:MAG: 3-methyladenine DNA glycosylase, partial [Anaerolineae bacterium]|nr:3-methyladenine DNA glycosylase [Anaerolineae bacterium]